MPLLLALLVAASLAYPSAPRGNVVDDYGGRRVPAPYRWMEDLDSPAVKQWVDAEDALTFSYLKAIPERDRIRERLTALWNYPRTEVPVREAGQLWYRRNAGLQKQSVLFRAPDVEVLDPNALSPDGSVAMNQWEVSPDGRWLVYSTAPGGSDVRDLRLRDLKTGKDIGEVVPRVKFSGISFTHDSRGFLYQRFKGTERSAAFAAANRFHQVWYHPIGGAQPDRLVFERARDPQDGVGGDGQRRRALALPLLAERHQQQPPLDRGSGEPGQAPLRPQAIGGVGGGRLHRHPAGRGRRTALSADDVRGAERAHRLGGHR